MKITIPVENSNTLAALQGFLKQLLEKQVVEAVLTPMRTPAGSITPGLVTNPEMLAQADPLAPVMPVNNATLAGKLSVKEPRARIAVVMRSCELRALIELVKMQQASLDNLTLIALDCAGTYSVPVYQRLEQKTDSWKELYRSVAENANAQNGELRAACRICEQPIYAGEAVHIELIGSEFEQNLFISLPEELAAQLDVAAAEVEKPQRQATLNGLIAARISARDAEFESIRSRLEGRDGVPKEGLPEIFSACIRCHNCMNVCPICYCKTCVFKSAVFDHEPMQFMKWAQQKGAYRMPADTMLFHMTRLNHMSLSCVGCGMCTEACPAELPVGTVFRAIGQRVQSVFDYAPGRSLEEPLPLVTFKADEWTEVGE